MNELFNLGLTNSGLNTAVTYDLDAVGSCQAAINAFIGGWDYQLSLSPAQKYGVYGSVCGSNLQGLTGASPVPQFVWGSDPDGNTSTSDLWYDPANCGVTSGSWIYHQRIKQWATNQTEVWGGVTETVDDNCLNTWVNPSGDGTDQNCL